MDDLTSRSAQPKQNPLLPLATHRKDTVCRLRRLLLRLDVQPNHDKNRMMVMQNHEAK